MHTYSEKWVTIVRILETLASLSGLTIILTLNHEETSIALNTY